MAMAMARLIVTCYERQRQLPSAFLNIDRTSVCGFGNSQGSYVCRFSSYPKKAYQHGDPEFMIRLFERQPSLRSNAVAVAQYVKALVKVHRLDESEVMKTLHRGISQSFRNVKYNKDGVLGTATTPIHVVAAEGGHSNEKLWWIVHVLGLAFVLISYVGTPVEDRGISKGT